MKFKFLTNLGLSIVAVAMISACGGGGSSSDDKVDNASDTVSETNNTAVAETETTAETDATIEETDEVVEEDNNVSIVVNDFSVTSTSFDDGGRIPSINVCINKGGSNQSPQLSWSDSPADTAKYAIIMDDEVSPCGTGDNACKHWGLFNIPSSVTEVSEDLDIETIEGAVEGKNYLGTQDYAGPCPPSNHTYKTTIFALDETMPNIGTVSMTRSQFESAYSNHILDSATISGTFP